MEAGTLVVYCVVRQGLVLTVDVLMVCIMSDCITRLIGSTLSAALQRVNVCVFVDFQSNWGNFTVRNYLTKCFDFSLEAQLDSKNALTNLQAVSLG